MIDRLTGKRILVSGGGSGIGRAVALRAAREGAAGVIVLDVSPTGASGVADEVTRLGAVGIPAVCDIRDEQEVESVLRSAIAESGGRLDGAVLSAAVQLIGEDGPITDLAIDVLRRTLDVNVVGTAVVAKHVARALSDGAGGAIVVIGSPTGLVGQPPDTSYGTSKAAVHGLARVMAAELAPVGVRVNVMVPGYTVTPLTRSISLDPARVSELIGMIPLGRAGQPEDAAAFVTFLLSDDASYATGALFTVDGGMTAV